MQKRSGYALSAALLLGLLRPVGAQEWTRFRGPNGSGISQATSVPVQWAETEVNWKLQLPGAGHSCPVVWKDRIFLTSADVTAQKRYVLCIGTNGKEIWRKTLDFPVHKKHNFNSFASATPAVDADAVYVMFNTLDSYDIMAFDHSGKELWKKDLGGYNAQHSGGSSPIVLGESLIVAKEPDEGESSLVALNRKTGAVKWQKSRPGKNAVYATPLVYQAKGGKPELIFQSTLFGFTSLDPATGELNWEQQVFKNRAVSSPILAGELIVGAAGQGGGARELAAVRPGSRGAGVEPKVEYHLQRGPSYVPTPLAYKDWIFCWGDGGIVTCLNASTGEQVWQERVGGDFFGSPICVNGKLYAISTRGEVVCIEAGPEFKVLGRSPLGEASHSTPSVADGVMYLRTEGHLFSVGGKK